MKKIKKMLCFILTFAMLLGLTLTTAYAAAPAVPDSIQVNIHKVVGDGGFTLKVNDGSLLTADKIAILGTNAVENDNGVVFTAWKVPTGSTVTQFADMTDVQMTVSYPNPVTLNAGVDVTFLKAAYGTYFVRETKHPSTLVDEIGVPFIMEIPVLSTDSTVYLTTLNLYPKNVISSSIPTIDKDVVSQGNDTATFDVGKTYTYFIYPTVPVGIKDYTKYEVSDTLDPQLTYLGNAKVYYNNVLLTNVTDYILTTPVPNGFVLTFTTAGKALLGATSPSTADPTHALRIEFDANINKTATMGTIIPNNATVTYNNGYMKTDRTSVVDQDKKPEVHTGGRQFVKVDNVTGGYVPELAAARFVVKNGDGKYMNVAADGTVTWVDTDDSTKATWLAPDSNGNFEVKGLAFGSYTLIEKVTPSLYLTIDPLAFTIDANSYSNAQVSNPTKVADVKKPIIPQTGGIGTIVFLVAGLMIMGASVLALRKKEGLLK